jgi:hypothetical protein
MPAIIKQAADDQKDPSLEDEDLEDDIANDAPGAPGNWPYES